MVRHPVSYRGYLRWSRKAPEMSGVPSLKALIAANDVLAKEPNRVVGKRSAHALQTHEIPQKAKTAANIKRAN